MNHDATFSTFSAVSFLAVVFITLYHRLKSWASHERLDQRKEGLFMLVALRLASLMLWLSVIAYSVNPGWMTWSAVPVPIWIRWIGTALCTLAIGLLNWTLRNLGTNLTDTVVTRRNHSLVTHGPYRFVRHPFYDSLAILILAMSMMSANWFMLCAGGTVLLLLAVRTRSEERNLVARFGDAYVGYMSRTGRFFPKRPVERTTH